MYAAVITHCGGELKYSKFRKCTKLEQLLQNILQKIGREI